jgi:hypothetical protein
MAQHQRSGHEQRDTARSERAGRTQSAPSSTGSRRDISENEISARAYELYERRGREDGHDWDDWLEAENELRARRHTPGPTPS